MRQAAVTAEPCAVLEPDWLAELNAEQRAAVDWGSAAGGDACPPLLVIAGAGTGKTLTLAARVARLVLQGADPNRVMAITFSRRAASSLARRCGFMLQRSLGGSTHGALPELPWCGTFHSVAARLLRQAAPRIGLAADFDVLDRADAEELMAQVRQSLNLHRSGERFPTAGTCLAIHSRMVNTEAPLRDVLARQWPWCDAWHDCLQALQRAYTLEKQRQHLLDLDDLLLYWALMLDEPALARSLQERFDHLLVDEYQDTNTLQVRIVRGMRPRGQGLAVVGDDAQAIYGFRGASVRGILDFEAAFDPPAQRVTLARNYRSTPQILAAANALMGDAAIGFRKALVSDRSASLRPRLVTVADEVAQAAWVADEVLEQREKGLPLKRQAVLFRTGHHSAALELELLRRRIRFVKYGGLRFFESAHVKDLLAVLRWARTPKARFAAQRVLRLVPGIGPATARDMLDALDAADDPLATLAAHQPSERVRGEWQSLERALSAARDAALPWPGALQSALDWYRPHLRRLHGDEARLREADLEQLLRIAATLPSAERFLTDIALDPPAASSDEAADPLLDEDYLILSTIHSAKGQEWSVVFVVNVVDGCIPSDMATGSVEEIEEERRLLYVAMTRARDELNLLVPQRFYVTQQRSRGDRHLYAIPSRFVTDAVRHTLDDMVTRAWTAEAGPERGAALLDVAAAALARLDAAD